MISIHVSLPFPLAKTWLTREIHALPFIKTKTKPLHFLANINSHFSLFFSFFISYLFSCFPLSKSIPMASNDLKQRVTHDPTTTMNDKRRSGGGGSRRDKRMAMAKRGLRSLAIAVSLPLSLTLLSAYLGSSISMHTQSRAHDAVNLRKPFWFPPSWALHLTCPASSFLMGLSAWLVWADGGFHTNPMALLLYLAQLLFTVLWDPIVFGAGATRVGLVVCLGLFGALLGCMRVFGQLNHTAGDLIKPCLASTAFLSIVNLKLLSV